MSAELDLLGDTPQKKLSGGYRGLPGAGPHGETCGSCEHSHWTGRPSRRYYKCALVAVTFGPGTDIRLKTPACQYWEKPK